MFDYLCRSRKKRISAEHKHVNRKHQRITYVLHRHHHQHHRILPLGIFSFDFWSVSSLICFWRNRKRTNTSIASFVTKCVQQNRTLLLSPMPHCSTLSTGKPNIFESDYYYIIHAMPCREVSKKKKYPLIKAIYINYKTVLVLIPFPLSFPNSTLGQTDFEWAKRFQ